MKQIKAVIGTNSWGGKVYGKILRGSYIEYKYFIISSTDIFEKSML